MEKRDKLYDSISTDEKRKNELVPEEFPDGPFGSSINKHEPARVKSTPWHGDQKQMSPFDYPDAEQHEDVPRQWPNADPLRDDDRP